MRAFSLERGWLHTIVDLSIRPSAMIRSYLGGKRVTYIGPVRYAATMYSLGIALVLLLPALPVVEGQPAAQQAIETYNRHFVIPIMMLAIPFYALLSWGLFRKAGLTYAEHVTMQFFVMGHAMLVYVPFEVAGRYFPSSYFALALVSLIVYKAYAIWAMGGVCARSLWSAISGGLLIQMVGLLVVMLAVTGLMVVIMVVQFLSSGRSA